MKVCIIIPVKRLRDSKSRLADVLPLEARVNLSLYLLEDLLDIIRAIDNLTPMVIGHDDDVKSIARRYKARFIKDDSKGVNDAIALADRYSKRFDASIVIPIDLPLMSKDDLKMLIDDAKDKKKYVIIIPSSRFDGTNILLRKPPSVMDTYYDMDSYLLHLNKALELGLEVSILLNHKLMHDLDSIDDIDYIIEHGSDKRSIRYLRSIL